jgi:hypothetical protein
MPTTPTPPMPFQQAVVDYYGTPLEAIADALSDAWPRLMCDGLQYEVAREALDALTHTFTLHLRETVVADLQTAGHLPPGPPSGVRDPDTPPGTEPLTPRELAALDDVQERAKRVLVSLTLIAYRLGHADGRACLEFPTDPTAPEPDVKGRGVEGTAGEAP